MGSVSSSSMRKETTSSVEKILDAILLPKHFMLYVLLLLQNALLYNYSDVPISICIQNIW